MRHAFLDSGQALAVRPQCRSLGPFRYSARVAGIPVCMIAHIKWSVLMVVGAALLWIAFLVVFLALKLSGASWYTALPLAMATVYALWLMHREGKAAKVREQLAQLKRRLHPKQ